MIGTTSPPTPHYPDRETSKGWTPTHLLRWTRDGCHLPTVVGDTCPWLRVLSYTSQTVRHSIPVYRRRKRQSLGCLGSYIVEIRNRSYVSFRPQPLSRSQVTSRYGSQGYSRVRVRLTQRVSHGGSITDPDSRPGRGRRLPESSGSVSVQLTCHWFKVRLEHLFWS